MYNNCIYADAGHTTIQAEREGFVVSIPVAPGNADYERLLASDVEIAPYSPPPLPVPSSISDRQFYQQLAVAGIISEADALASNAAVIPAALTAIIDAMPDEQQFPARMLLGGATVFERQNPYTIAIGTAYGWSSEQVDDFFRAAALL